LDDTSSDLAHAPLGRQVAGLGSILESNRIVGRLLDRLAGLALPDWYLGGGAIAQTVWNALHGFDPTHGISDYDVVYFDPRDLTAAGEHAVEAAVATLVDIDGATGVDVTNEARVHLWYEKRFGRPLDPYRSSEQAIATWPTTATSLGVRLEGSELVVCAPFGLSDLFAMIVRPNTALVDEPVYRAKAEHWRQRWPNLAVHPWPGG
jgi:hypothetical protein